MAALDEVAAVEVAAVLDEVKESSKDESDELAVAEAPQS